MDQNYRKVSGLLRGNLRQALWPAIIVIVAVTLRVIGISWSIPNAYHLTTYNCDEYTLLTSLQGIDPGKLDFNPVSEKAPYALSSGTLYLYTYAAMIKAMSLTGWITLIGNKEFYYNNLQEWTKFFITGRALSILYGLLTIWFLYLLAEKMYGRRAALISAGFLAIMPAHVIYSRYMLANTSETFWAVLAFYFLKRIMDEGRTKDYLLAGACTGLANATRYSSAPLLPMIFIAHLIGPEPLKNLKKPLLSIAMAAIAFLLGMPYAILDPANFLKGLSAIKGSTIGAAHTFMSSASLTAVYAGFTESLGIILLLLCIAGVILAIAKRTKNDVLLLFWVLPLTIIFIKSGTAATPGRMLPLLPFLALLGARALDLAWARKASGARIVLTAILIHAGLFHLASLKLVINPDIRDIASEWILNNVQNDASIGLIKEPSWSGPGIIDRKYRHPDHKPFPNHKFISLTRSNWSTYTDYELLDRIRPDFIVVSDVEEQLLEKRTFFKDAENLGYTEVQRFTNSLSVRNVKLQDRLPSMFYMPNYISILQRTSHGIK